MVQQTELALTISASDLTPNAQEHSISYCTPGNTPLQRVDFQWHSPRQLEDIPDCPNPQAGT